MRKGLMIGLVFLILGTIFGCVDNQIEQRFQQFISNMDDTITETKGLPTSFEDIDIVYYFGDEVIDQIEYTYATKDVILTIEAVLQTPNEIRFQKQFIVSKSEFMHNLYVTTNDHQEIVSKDEYIRGQVTLASDGPFEKEDLEMRIRGRGNSTWDYPKKPYRIKFDERQSLLGMAAAKDYVLLAEYNDKSLMRNYLAHYFSQFLKFDRYLETRYVSLFINDEYQGVYLLTEQVQVDSARLNIDESDLSHGGFLIELESDDRIGQEGIMDIDWIRVDGSNFVIKSPDMEDYSEAVVEGKITYMKDYLIDFLESIENDTYEDFIDVDSFVDFFVLTELFKQVDVGYSSVYAHKDVDGKLKMGPIWDFDISSGNGDYYDYGPSGYWVDYNPWFNKLIDQPSFEARYISRFNEVLELYFNDLLDEIDHVSSLLLPFAETNFAKWDILDHYIWPNPPEMVAARTHPQQVNYLKNYLIDRAAWLENELNSKGYYKD